MVYSENRLTHVSFGLFIGYVYNNKNIEYQPSLTFNISPFVHSETFLSFVLPNLLTFNLLSHPRLMCLTELLLLSSNDTPPFLSGSLRALEAGVSMKPLFSLCLLSTSLIPVRLFKRGSPGASPSVVSLPLIPGRGRRQGRLAAVRQENSTP